LALLQIVIALAAIVYAPYEYRAGPHPIHDDFMMARRRQLWPPWALRACSTADFPALAAIIPFRFTGGWTVYDVVDYRGHVPVRLSVDDCLFLAAVGLLWYCLGGMIDRRKRDEIVRPEWSRIVGLIIGCLFSEGVLVLAGFYATRTDADRPFREIGFAGLAWAIALTWYFVSNLLRALRAHTIE
jgi:hypothetical protein